MIKAEIRSEICVLVILSSVLIGMLFSLLLGVAAIRFKADQTLVGTALNLRGCSPHAQSLSPNLVLYNTI